MSDTTAGPAEGKAKKHKYVKYTHHDQEVFVREDLKGKHRNVCLCFSCDRFKQDAPERCKIAFALYNFVVEKRIVAPVWECPEFQELGSTKGKAVTGVSGDVVK